ncbi:MAG: ClpXP protease specificity-enhancing factor [Pseudomonadota bacterium]
MTSLKPYLIRSIYEWVIDNRLTPHILVDADAEDAVLPRAYIHEGKIILNIRPEAVQALSLGNTHIEFNARFGGQPMQVRFPVTNVLAIYAMENGKGMIFDNDGDDTPPPSSPDSDDRPAKPVLKVVK